MTTGPIPSVRAAHLFAFLDLLHSIGAPVDRGLRFAKLPTMVADQPDTLVSLLQTQDFLNAMAHDEGIDDFALRAKKFTTIEQQIAPSVLGTIYSAPTLKIALETAFRLVKHEITHIDCWMIPDGSTVRICHSFRIPFDARGAQHLELGSNTNFVRLIQAFAGPQWYPNEMAFRSQLPLGQFVAQQFPNTRLLVGQKTAWIALPRAMLSLPPRIKQSSRAAQPASGSPSEAVWDFSGSLKRVLAAYLRDGYPDIRLAAEIVGTSVRTLQRQLAKGGMSYSELMQQARFEAAAEMLKDPDISVINIAYDLGYEDPSNFARAFRRIAGVSPREYRRHYCPQ